MRKAKQIVCTLTNSQRARRGSTWIAALTKARARTTDVPGGVLIRLDGEKSGLNEIEELVRAEQECCAWMNLTLRHSRTGATLSITSDSSEGSLLIRKMIGAVSS